MNVGSVLFRASRNVLMPLIAVTAACLINVFGDLGFGLGMWGLPAFGASGIAWSTFAAVCVGAALLLFLLRHAGLTLPRVLPSAAWMCRAAPYLLKVSLPALLTQFLWQGGYLSLFVIMAALPDSVDELAGMTAGIRVESMLFMPAVAFNMTAAIMVGNLLGAGKVAEARRTGLAITVLGALCMSVVSFLQHPFHPVYRGQHDLQRCHDRSWRHAVHAGGEHVLHLAGASAPGLAAGAHRVGGIARSLHRDADFHDSPGIGHALGLFPQGLAGIRHASFRRSGNEFFIESFREHSAIGSICRSEPNVPARSFHARSESRSFDSGNILKPKGSDAIPAVLLTCPLLFSGGEFEY